MTNPKLQPQTRIVAYEGLKVETVKQKGSLGQKMMVTLFDFNNDGELKGNEVTEFNRHNFTVKKGEITMYGNKKNGKREITVLKYDNFDEDINRNCSLNNYCFKNKNGEKCNFDRLLSDYGKTVIDMITGKVTLEGVECASIKSENIELSIKDSWIAGITPTKSDLVLKNTNAAHGSTTPVTICTDGESTIKTDGKSQFRTEPQE